ncbi:MAG: M48 family metallopeptidase [Candidatus Nanoarchaeia archaeon]
MLHSKQDIEVKGASYEVLVYIEKRNNSRISIGKKVNIRVPCFLSKEEREKQISYLINWAKKKIESSSLYKKKDIKKEFKDKEWINVQGFEYHLSVEESEKDSSSARFLKNNIKINLSSRLSETEKQKHINCLVYKCISNQWGPFVEKRVKELNEKHFRKEINSVRLKNLKSRWGSCSGRENINICTALLFAPQEVLDYVIIHELAHLIEPNHSKKFWELVEKAMPDFREKIKWLKKNKWSLIS